MDILGLAKQEMMYKSADIWYFKTTISQDSKIRIHSQLLNQIRLDDE